MKTETSHTRAPASEVAPQRRHGWAAVLAAALMIAVLLVATAAGFRFVHPTRPPPRTAGR